MAQYDKIAKQYSASQEDRPLRKYLVDPSFLKELDLRRLPPFRVLELGCGSGHLTRQMARVGAPLYKDKIVGLDNSIKMLEFAWAEEFRHPLGIYYSLWDVFDKKCNKDIERGNLRMPKDSASPMSKPFDIVAPTFLLHYAKSKAELARACAFAYNCLCDLPIGGRLVAINQNPDALHIPYCNQRQFGSEIKPVGKLREGGEIECTLFHGDKKVCSFLNYYWEKETYNEALRTAGFKNIEWKIPEVSEEGIRKFGKEFWDRWYKRPTIALITARK